jgi:hypothetical protein
LGKEKVPKDSEEIDQTVMLGRRSKVCLRETNARLYEELILSIDSFKMPGKYAFNLVKLAKTKALADGDATLAWKTLKVRYATKTEEECLL